MKKTTQLKKLLRDKEIAVMMEAHNGLTAKLVEEAGFTSIWGSGLSLSAALGVRDNNEASWTQVLDQLEQRDVAGVCLEDKLFPKTNSFIGGEQQPLAEISEFAGKIKAGKDIQKDADFVIVARTEAFIAGWGLEEALKRANAYADAGADAVLIHSKIKTPVEVYAFLDAWKRDTPVVLVPTMYPTVTLKEFEQRGASLVIWANQTCRTVITAVQQNLRILRESGSLSVLEDKIIPVKEIFRLQGADDLQEKEKLYLPAQGETTNVVILAATQGKGFGKMTENRPKTMIPIGGKPILGKLVGAFNDCGLKHIGVVRGFAKDAVNLPNLKFFDNDAYETTEEAASLFAAKPFLGGRTIVSFGDILFEKFVLLNLLDSDAEVTIVVDSNWSTEKTRHQRKADLVIAERKHTREYREDDIHVTEIGNGIDPNAAYGEWIGLVLFSKTGGEKLAATLEEMSKQADFGKKALVDVLAAMVAKGVKVKVEYIHGHWLDIDNLDDVSDAYLFDKN